MKNRYYSKSDGTDFHVVRFTKDNIALCGYTIPEKVSYQVITGYPFHTSIMCDKCSSIADKEIAYNTREEVRNSRKKYLAKLVCMSNEELLAEYDYNNYCCDENYDEHRYNVTMDYFVHRLKLYGFLK